MGGSIRRTSISLPDEILKAGQQIAKGRRRNFSNYVADLIAADAEKSLPGIIFGDFKEIALEDEVDGKSA